MVVHGKDRPEHEAKMSSLRKARYLLLAKDEIPIVGYDLQELQNGVPRAPALVLDIRNSRDARYFLTCLVVDLCALALRNLSGGVGNSCGVYFRRVHSSSQKEAQDKESGAS